MMTKFKLNVPERVLLMEILPQEGSFVILKILREAVDKIGFNDEELNTYNIRSKDGKITWSPKGLDRKEIEVGDRAIELIVDVLEKLDTEKKLKQQQFTLYEKFVKGGN